MLADKDEGMCPDRRRPLLAANGTERSSLGLLFKKRHDVTNVGLPVNEVVAALDTFYAGKAARKRLGRRDCRCGPPVRLE